MKTIITKLLGMDVIIDEYQLHPWQIKFLEESEKVEKIRYFYERRMGKRPYKEGSVN